MDASNPHLSPAHTWGVIFGRILVCLLRQQSTHDQESYQFMQGLFQKLKENGIFHSSTIKRVTSYSIYSLQELTMSNKSRQPMSLGRNLLKE